jgi:hypothetical protein
MFFLLTLKVAELKERLKKQGSPVSGKKDELIKRLLSGPSEPKRKSSGELEKPNLKKRVRILVSTPI